MFTLSAQMPEPETPVVTSAYELGEPDGEGGAEF